MKTYQHQWPRNLALTTLLGCALMLDLNAAQVTIVPVPSLGGSSSAAKALNRAGQIAGYSQVLGDSAQHADLFSAGKLYDLGTLGGTYSVAFALNNKGEVVGEASIAYDLETHAFVYRQGQMLDLGTLGGTYSTAVAINNAGQIAGNAYLAGDLESRPFLCQQGVMTNLGTLGGSYSSAKALNSNGVVVGDSLIAGDAVTHAFLWRDGLMTDLGTLGGSRSSAMALNDAGQVVGEAYTTHDLQTHAFLYQAGVMTDLGTLGGTFSSAKAINNLGQVIGDSTTAQDAASHGFIYSGGVLTDLGTLGGSYCSPTALNNRGQVVGQAADATEATFPFRWQDGAMQNLNSLLPPDSGWELWSADGINDAGQIFGYGLYQGQFSWYLLSFNRPPVAEAGPDLIVECASPALLDGSGSSDPDGDLLSYEWRENELALGSGVSLAVSLGLGTHTVTLTVTDPLGASASDTLTVTVRDTTAPTVASPASVSALVDANCQASVPDVLASTIASDACTPAAALVKAQSPPAGTLVGVGTHPITVTVTDASGNAGTSTTPLTVADRIVPVVTAPAPVTLPAGANCQAAVPDLLAGLNATDNCTPAAQLLRVQDPPAGTLVGLGQHLITLTVTDASGNSATCTTTLAVVDRTPPALLCPEPVVLPAGPNGQAAMPDFLTSLNAADNCTPAAELVRVQNPPAGTPVGLGQHLITLTVTDASGNSAACSATLRVVDTTPPVFTCPEAMFLTADASGKAAVPDLLAGLDAADNCTPADALLKTQNPPAGTLAGPGQHLVTLTVTDASGNSASCTTTLTVLDVTPPVIGSLEVSPDTLYPNKHVMIPVTVTVSASDNCDPAPVSRIICITSNEPVTGKGGNTNPDWEITGPLTANLRAERSNQGDGRIYTLTVECRDALGNATTGAVTVTVPK